MVPRGGLSDRTNNVSKIKRLQNSQSPCVYHSGVLSSSGRSHYVATYLAGGSKGPSQLTVDETAPRIASEGVQQGYGFSAFKERRMTAKLLEFQKRSRSTQLHIRSVPRIVFFGCRSSYNHPSSVPR